MAGAVHLTKRFFGSLLPLDAPRRDLEWIGEQLIDAEIDIWRSMSRVDRRHAAGVARRVERAMGHEATRPVLAAALLHDCGKTVSGLGTYGRVMATLSAAVAGRDMAEAWSRTRGVTRRIGLYLLHEELGADMLAVAGSDALTVTLVREWSRPEEDVTAPIGVLRVLRAADDG